MKVMKVMSIMAPLSFFLLSGCADGMKRIHATSDPIVKTSSDIDGAFGKDILSIRPPISREKIKLGECWNYVVSGNLPYYVVVTPGDKVSYHGFKTCADAKNEGVF